MTDRRALWGIATGYVLLRILIAHTVPLVDRHADTPSYLVNPSFTGHTARPWAVPLLYWTIDPSWVRVVQAGISAFAFLVLAAALASTVTDRRIKIGIAAVVLLMGVAPRTTTWDAMMVSESLALSLTALLIAGLIWIDRVPWWAVGGVFCLWVFTRDGHLYLGALVLIGVAVWCWQHRRPALAVAMLTVMLWGGLAARNDDTIESYNVVSNIAYRAPLWSHNWFWFVDHGMPVTTAFESELFFERQERLLADDNFREWAATDGPGAYAEFMATHPLFVIGGFEYLIASPPGDGSLVDAPPSNEPIGVPFWPGEASAYTAGLVIAALIAAMALSRQGAGKRGALPILLLLSTFPHALLAYHATPLEVARHGIVLAFVLVVACWWLIALAVDQRMSGDPVLRHQIGEYVAGVGLNAGATEELGNITVEHV